MQLRIKKLTDTAKAPTKAHTTDLGYDLYADEDVSILFLATVKISTNICIGFPEGWGGLVKDRSSMASKCLRIGGGVIDNGYTGHLSVIMTNFQTEPEPEGDGRWNTYEIKKGDKIAQLVLVPLTNFDIVETDTLEDTDRGQKGFGSSGT